MDMSLFSITLILFLIMDPLGNIASYLKLIEGIPPRRVTWVVCREMTIALLFMILFIFIGEFILSILEISEITVRIASAMIIFLTAIKILFPATNSLRANLPAGEPFITPLAVPLIAGPSLLATIMLFAHIEPSSFTMFASIGIAWLASTIILLNAPLIHRIVGNNGLMAAERLTGMLLVMLAVQRFMEGIHQFITNHCR